MMSLCHHGFAGGSMENCVMGVSRRRLLSAGAIVGLGAAFPAVRRATPASLASLKFGTSAGINTAIQPALYAKAAGLFAKNGLDVSFVDMADDTTAVQALIAGACEMLYAGAGTGMVAISHGADIKLVSSFTPWTDFVLLAQKDITSVKQLEGQTVGISKIGALNYEATVYALKKGGVDPTKVQFLATGTDAQRAQALAGGKIVAGTVNGTAAVAALDAKPDLHMLYDVGAAFRASFMSTAVFARGDLIKAHPQIVQNAVTALIEACRGLQGDKAVAIAQAEKSGLPAHSVEVAYQHLFEATEPYYGIDGGLNKEQIQATLEILKNDNDFDQIPPYTKVVDDQFVTAALKQLGPYQK
jgi:NitT/TauT family transport system substrate-binding protein